MNIFNVLDPSLQSLLDVKVSQFLILDEINKFNEISCDLIGLKNKQTRNLFTLEIRTAESILLINKLFFGWNELFLRDIRLNSINPSIIFDDELRESIIIDLHVSILNQVTKTFLASHKKIKTMIMKTELFEHLYELFREEDATISACIQDYLAFKLRLKGWDSELLCGEKSLTGD